VDSGIINESLPENRGGNPGKVTGHRCRGSEEWMSIVLECKKRIGKKKRKR
jgi:hypothetical protein